MLQRQLSSADFALLKAAAQLGLVPDPWLQTATTAAAAHNAGVVISAAMGLSVDPKSILSPEAFIPGGNGEEKAKASEPTLDQQQQRHRSKYR